MAAHFIVFFSFLVASLSAPTTSHTHGGVVLEEDICLIKVGFYQAHFTIFQPETRRHEQFCEDLPDIGESIFVLEYLHDGLEEMAVDFRIIRNTTGQGQFANLDDIRKINDLDAVTVFYQPPVTEPDIFAAMHDFKENAEFIGIVEALDLESNKVYTAVFPFETGFTSSDVGEIVSLIAIPILILLWLTYFFVGKKRRKAQGSALALTLLAIVLPHNTLGATDAPLEPDQKEIRGSSQNFDVLASPRLNPIRINQIHSWDIVVSTKRGEAVSGAKIDISGGMPLHDHGLPTAPRMIQESQLGHYRVDGVKFHMRGYWELYLLISIDDEKERLTLGFNL
tara:strand:+ start:246 stop:1259 length:1014 start_codon:yes stop_codon:yes gene_type:complete